MRFWKRAGDGMSFDFEMRRDNDALIRRLEEAAAEDRVSHAYIFEGDSRLDKRKFAEGFIKEILCPKTETEYENRDCRGCSICSKIDHGNHEDIIYISSDGNSVKDAHIIEVQERIKIKPFGSRNIVVVEDSDAMTVRAQNRFLKTLEEPPEGAVIILLSENMENLLPTIQSRCVKYRLNCFSEKEENQSVSAGREIFEMTLMHAPFYKMKGRLEKIARDKENTAEFLDSLQMEYRNLLINDSSSIRKIKDEEIMNRIHEVETARRQIKQGVSPSYALKNLILKIGG